MCKLYDEFSSESNLIHSSIDNDINTTFSTPVMNIFEKIISIIAPFRCLGCGADGELVCVACAGANFVPFSGLLPANYFVLCEYAGLAAKLVKALKFDRASQAAALIAIHMDDGLPRTDWDIVTYLPTAPARARKRGYDQSKLIAKELAGRRRLEVGKLLIRLSSDRQVGKTRETRRLQMIGAFAAAGDARDLRILLIDDVMTTGASLGAAREVLISAGARSVDCVVFAGKG